MIFTREDILKILNALLQLGRKDSEFKDANTPLNSDDEIAILQDGINKKVSINNLLSTLGLLKKDDFINVSDRYDEYYIQLSEAITIIAKNKRKRGLVITFQDLKGDWKVYQFKGVLNQWNQLDLWEDLFDWGRFVIDSILPDEEDLTKSLPDENGNSYLSLKDRAYGDGMGYVILRKNKSFVEQVTKSNTIYEIRYDFDLNGEEVHIPKGCVLNFQGGSIVNGVIQGFNTGITTFNNENIFVNVVNKGTWSVKNILSKWWSDKGNDLAESISNMAKGNSCYIEFEYNEEYRYNFIGDDSGLYSILVPSVYLFEKCGNIEINLNGSTHIMNPNSSKWYRMFSFLNCENSYIGNGVLIGDRLNHTYNNTTDEWGHGIYVIGKRCKIEKMNISQFTGDAISVGGFYYVSGGRWIGELYGCQIIGCELHHCRRHGISFGFTRIDSICNITNNNIHDIGTNDGINGTSPMSGINIEPSTNQEKPETIAGIFIIENNVIKNCTNNSIISSWGNAVVEQIEINGLKTDSVLNLSSPKFLHINNLKYDGIVFGSNNNMISAKNKLIISNSKFNLLGGKPFYIQNGLVKNCDFVGNKDANEVYSSVLSYESINTVIFENCKFKDILGAKLENTGRYSNGISVGIEILSPYFKFYNCVFDNCSGRFLYNRNVEFIDCVIKGGSYWHLWNTKIEGCYIENIDSNSTGNLVLTKCSILEDFNRSPYYTILENKLVLHNSCLKVSTISDYDTRFDASKTNCIAYNSELSYDVRHMAAMKNIVAINSVVQSRSDTPSITLISSSYCKIGYEANNPIGTERPTIGIYVGYQYYDKTINKPIWYDGTKWIDATGADV